MIDIFKFSKKNKICQFIITKILQINVHLLSKPLFLKYNVLLDLNDNFFYEYKKKYPLTKWMTMKESGQLYQSNHDLNSFSEMKESVKTLEKILNTEIKKKILKIKTIGRFKIKNIWFSIQKENQGHHSHNHPKSVLSGVYYFKIDNNSGGEINLELDTQKIQHIPQKNDLLIFNSSVYHSVNPYFGKNDRIAIAWDAIYTF
tara:strand:+ start:194 stop:799 length:606 start_codon:yes stop_codon:yes gene_type:complete